MAPLIDERRSNLAYGFSALKRFIEPKAMNIRDLGETTLSSLYAMGYVMGPEDLFNVEWDVLASRGMIRHNRYIKITQSLLMVPSIPLPNVFYALNIPGVGLDTGVALAEQFKTLTDFKERGLEQDEMVLDQEAKDNIADWLDKPVNQKYLIQLISRGIGDIPWEDPKKSKPCYGDRWYFIDQNNRTLALRKRLQRLGAAVLAKLDKRTTHVVVTDMTHPSVDYAWKYGAKLLTLDEAFHRVTEIERRQDEKITNPMVRHAIAMEKGPVWEGQITKPKGWGQ